MFNPIISALLRGSWLIDEQFANNSLPLVLGFLKGNLNGSEFLNGSGNYEGPFFIHPDDKKVSAYKYDRNVGGLALNLGAAIPGSIAVVPFIGPVTKYNGSCGEPGMVQRQQWISEMTSLPGIAGYISLIDSPGGQADGTPQTADLIKSLKLATAAVIVGGAYSAGAWVASGHDKIYAADKFSGFGSIGAYTTIVDYRGYFEKEGYKIQSIYPKVSKDKNLSYRQAIDGNTNAIEAEVSDLAQSFVDAFSENRSGKLTSVEWNTGKVYSATEAVRIGLIDAIKPMNQVLIEMRSLPKTNLNLQKTKNSNMETSNIEALAGIETPTEDQLSLANADLTSAGITHVTLVPETIIAEAQAVTAERDSLKTANTNLNAQLSEANTEKVTAQSNLATANNTITELKSKVEAFGQNSGAVHKQTGAEGIQPDADSSEGIISNLAHNKAAEEYLGR